MGERLDRLRSLVRGAGKAALDARPLASVQKAFAELREFRTRIDERSLSRVVLRSGTVREALVRAVDGRIELHIQLESGRELSAALTPGQPRFAPRGAKEIFFRVDPPEAASDFALREVAGALAARIARAVWSPVLPAASFENDASGIVDREGDELRIDLRTCPSVRSALSGSTAQAAMVELIGVEKLFVDDRALHVQLALPRIS